MTGHLRASNPGGDREFVDGGVVERRIGTVPHAGSVTNVKVDLVTKYWELRMGVRARVRVISSRIRAGDVVSLPRPVEHAEIIETPPFLIFEALATEDSAVDVFDRVEDYLAISRPDGFLRTGNPELVAMGDIF